MKSALWKWPSPAGTKIGQLTVLMASDRTGKSLFNMAQKPTITMPVLGDEYIISISYPPFWSRELKGPLIQKVCKFVKDMTDGNLKVRMYENATEITIPHDENFACWFKIKFAEFF
jgi:hypothetical protein